VKRETRIEVTKRLGGLRERRVGGWPELSRTRSSLGPSIGDCVRHCVRNFVDGRREFGVMHKTLRFSPSPPTH
jgi:hypothetical protein